MTRRRNSSRSVGYKKSYKNQQIANKGDSKLPSGPVAKKTISLTELKFLPMQEFRMWLPGPFITISSSAGSLVNTVAICNDPGEGTYGAKITPTLASVFQQLAQLHTRITIMPQMETGTNQQAMLAVGIDTESATAYADKNEASSGNTFMMPLSSAAQSCVQFTVYNRSYDELIWTPPNTTVPAGQRIYLKLYGDSTTGLGATKTIVQLRFEFFVALRGLKQV